MSTDEISSGLQHKLGYACIYSRGIDEAVEHLEQLLIDGRAGYDEGKTFWAAAIHDWLDTRRSTAELILPGSTLTEEEWRIVLERLVERLDR